VNTEQRILCLAARTRLDEMAERRLVELLRGLVNWEYLWAQGHLHEVLPLVGMQLRRLRDQAPMPAEWLQRTQRLFLATLLQNTTLRDELLRVLAAFEAAGVQALPVKGIVVTEALYGNLGLRPAKDLDILVRWQDLPVARAALRELGFAQSAQPSFTERAHPVHDPPYYRWVDGRAIVLELHFALWRSHLFSLDTDHVWARAVPLELHGRRVLMMSPEDMLLHLAIHRSRSPLRLRYVCDIAEFLERHHETLDWNYVVKQTTRAGARTALLCSLNLAAELLDAPFVQQSAEQLGVGRLKRQLLGRICGQGALFRHATPEDLSQEPRPWQRLLMLDNLRQVTRGTRYQLGLTLRKRLNQHRSKPD
jgi:hypothetical protein